MRPRRPSPAFVLAALLAFSAPLLVADPVNLTGANGRVVEFAGVWEARPEGLTVITDAESPLQTVPWDRFDLVRLRTDQPGIHAARQRAIFLRSAQPVNLGLFADLLTPSQVGAELRRILETQVTVKVPPVDRTTTETTTQTSIGPVYPHIYDGLVIVPPEGFTNINQRTTTETETRRVTPDELTTTPRRVLEHLSRTDGVASSDRRALFELAKYNSALLLDPAQAIERVRSALPPKRLLANDPTLQTLSQRLEEAAGVLRDLPTGLTVQPAQQDGVRRFLQLVEHPVLQ